MRKRIAAVIMCGAMLIGLCTGCGENTAGDKREASGSAVAAEGAAEHSVTGKPAEKTNANYTYANSTNLYIQKADSEKEVGFDQYTLEGKKKKSFTLKGFDDIVWVDDEGVYYVMDTGDGSRLCRFPLHKGKDGTDELEEKNPEEIINLGEEGSECIFFTPKYIIYDTDECSVFRFDRKTHENKRIIIKKDKDIDIELEAVFGEKIAIYDWDRMSLVIVDINTGETEYLPSIDYHFENVVAEDRYFICWEQTVAEQGEKAPTIGDETREENCKIYDSVTKKTERLISWEELKQTLLKNEKITEREFDNSEDYCDLSNLFYYNGRVYVELELGILRNSVVEKKTAVLSKSITGKDGLIYEREMTEALRSNCDEVKGVSASKQRVTAWDSGCFALINGKMIFYLWTGKKGKETAVGHYDEGMYDIRTGKFTRLSNKDAEYYYPFYVEGWDTLNLTAGFSHWGGLKNIVWK